MAAQYFNPSFSSKYVPKYAPLPLDTVQFGVQQANQTRQAAMDNLDLAFQTESDILGQLTPQNRAQAKPILESNREFLDRLANPDTDVRYADMVPMLRRRVRQTKQQLQPYIQDSARIRAFREELESDYDAGRVSDTFRRDALARISDYGGLTFDDEGNPQGFSAPSYPNAMDIEGQMQDFIDTISKNSSETLINEYGADPRFVQEIKTNGLTYETAMQAMKNNLLLNPEAQRYMQAELQAENRLRERQGQAPLDLDTYTEMKLAPIAATAPSRETSFRRNPAFTVQGTGSSKNPFGIGSERTREIMIGNPTLPIESFGDLRERQAEVTAQLEQAPQTAMQMLDPELRSRATIGEDGRITVSDPVVDGVDKSMQVDIANAKIDELKMMKTAYDSLDEDLRQKSGLSDLDPETEAKFEQYKDEFYDLFLEYGGGRTQNEFGIPVPIPEAERREKFRRSRFYDMAVKRISEESPEFADYVERFEKVIGQGQFKVGVPANLSSTERTMLREELKTYGISEELENATTRKPYTREQAAELINNAVEINPIGPVVDTNANQTYIAYNILQEGETEPVRVLLPAQGVGGYAALESAGYGAHLRAGVGQQVYGLSTMPGGKRTTRIRTSGDSPDIRVELLSLDEQDGYRKYVVDVPFGDGTVRQRYFSNEPGVINFLDGYFKAYNEKNR